MFLLLFSSTSGPCSRFTLTLPSYTLEQRVCEKCRKQVLVLRQFLNKWEERMVNNVEQNTGKRVVWNEVDIVIEMKQ